MSHCTGVQAITEEDAEHPPYYPTQLTLVCLPLPHLPPRPPLHCLVLPPKGGHCPDGRENLIGNGSCSSIVLLLKFDQLGNNLQN